MKLQIAREIFLMSLSVMKSVLSLMEFKLGKDSEDYKYFKKQVMDYVYTSLLRLFLKLEVDKVLVRCTCGAKLRQGYAQCTKCAGAGYVNSDTMRTENS